MFWFDYNEEKRRQETKDVDLCFDSTWICIHSQYKLAYTCVCLSFAHVRRDESERLGERIREGEGKGGTERDPHQYHNATVLFLLFLRNGLSDNSP